MGARKRIPKILLRTGARDKNPQDSSQKRSNPQLLSEKSSGAMNSLGNKAELRSAQSPQSAPHAAPPTARRNRPTPALPRPSPVHCGWGAPAEHCGEPPAQPVVGRPAAQPKRPPGSELAGQELTRLQVPAPVAFPPRSRSPAPEGP